MTGRDRRLMNEWDEILERFSSRTDCRCTPVEKNFAGAPVRYLVLYRIRSICGVDAQEMPLFADEFLMEISLGERYPSIDDPAKFRFLSEDPSTGRTYPLPWHPNIRYGGPMAGRVCINAPDSWASLAWAVDRVGEYLRYHRYHATNEPPFPEDQRVAAWVCRKGEAENLIFFDGNES